MNKNKQMFIYPTADFALMISSRKASAETSHSKSVGNNQIAYIIRCIYREICFIQIFIHNVIKMSVSISYLMIYLNRKKSREHIHIQMFSKHSARLINYILNIIHSHCQREGERLRAVLTSKYLLPPRTGDTGRERKTQ